MRPPLLPRLLAPRLHRRLPGPLLAVVLPSAAVILLDLDMERVGSIPRALAPHWPSFDIKLSSLISPILMVFALASLESLLSAAAVDKLARNTRHDPDQEFIGQGLANVGSALFGGIPVTGVIARSALNVQAGARTRKRRENQPNHERDRAEHDADAHDLADHALEAREVLPAHRLPIPLK